MNGLKLRSEVFLREDLEAILRAIVVANNHGGHSPHDAARRQGFAQAIVAMAVAIHVEPPPITDAKRVWLHRCVDLTVCEADQKV